ncbi:MAG: hypothetical protein ACOC3T_01030 [Bacteroidota bacterium]
MAKISWIFLMKLIRWFNVFSGNIDAYRGRFDMFSGNVHAHCGRFDMFSGNVHAHCCRFDMFSGNVHARCGRFDVFSGNVHARCGRFDACIEPTMGNDNPLIEPILPVLKIIFYEIGLGNC